MTKFIGVPEHYHINGYTYIKTPKNIDETFELVIDKKDDKWRVVDIFGDISNECDKVLMTCPSLYNATKQVIRIFRTKYPNCKFIYGAGTPDNFEEIVDETK